MPDNSKTIAASKEHTDVNLRRRGFIGKRKNCAGVGGMNRGRNASRLESAQVDDLIIFGGAGLKATGGECLQQLSR